jgi:hypothetical protein
MLHGPLAISEKDELGAEIIQQHLDRHSGRLSAAYNRVQKILCTMGEYLVALGEQERSQRRDIQIATEMLCCVSEKVAPRGGVDGEVYVLESEFGAWEKRLEEAKEAAAAGLIYWAAYVIKVISKSHGSGRR